MCNLRRDADAYAFVLTAKVTVLILQRKEYTEKTDTVVVFEKSKLAPDNVDPLLGDDGKVDWWRGEAK